MRKQRPRQRPPVEAHEPDLGLEAKTIRFHRGVWEQVKSRAGHVNPTEWLRAEIYEKVLGLSPEDVERSRAA